MFQPLKDGIVLVHFSDNHINEILENSKFPRFFRGYAGHDFNLLRGLRNAFRFVREMTGIPPQQPLHFVDSGDRTASGATPEYNMATTIEGILLPRSGSGNVQPPDYFGIPRWERVESLVSIPGNHDQWAGDGIRMWGFNPSLAGARFEACPWTRVWENGSLKIELWGLDSNAGFAPSPTGDWNWFARGALDANQVAQLRKQLSRVSASANPKTKCRLRILVLHHSLAYKSRWQLSFHERSRVLLEELLAEGRFHALLTGHTHDFSYYPALPLPTGQQVWELRCASTLQGPARRTPAPGFLVHRIWADENLQPHWHTWRFLWQPGRFAPNNPDAPDWFVIP